MRMTLLVAAVLGLASFSTGANAASPCAQYSVNQCVSNGHYHCTANQQTTFYHQCLNDQAVRLKKISNETQQANVNAARTQVRGHTGSAAYKAR